MTDPKLFQLTEKDKAKYLELIDEIDTVHSRAITKVIGRKISGMLDDGKLNSVEIALIDDIAMLGHLRTSSRTSQFCCKKDFVCHDVFCG